MVCPIYRKIKSMISTRDTIDNLYWGCRGTEPIHDEKINIRINSIFEGFKVSLNTLYYLLFYCFVKNMRIKRTHKEVSNFCKIMNHPKPSFKTIIKVFCKFRCKIK